MSTKTASASKTIADTTPLLPFETLITQGGDERLNLLDNGYNKYLVNPTDHQGVFNRGSCTCSPFTLDGYDVAAELYQRLDDKVFDQTRAEHTAKIKNLINYKDHDRFHVFYAPSGSDLCYYQLLFAKLINPELDIFSLITCPEELGSGSNAAIEGRYFFNTNQFGDKVELDGPIGDNLQVECARFAARDTTGEIINHSRNIQDLIHNKYKTHSVNANMVIGSKSGIENSINIVSQTADNVFWTVDLCQFRASQSLINGLIGMNCAVMLTGSKFYQSPPFCAALLVPKTLTERFSNFDPALIKSFAGIFSRYDIPEEFAELREHLPDFRNYGLMLRWEAALDSMLKLAEVDSYDINCRIDDWHCNVVEHLTQKDCFQLMPGQEETNKTIISFRVKSGPDTYLCHDDLLKLYRTLCGGKVEGLEGFSRVLFGQPVKYGDRSFIRIALGANDLHQFATTGFNPSNDNRLVDIIEEYVRATHWNN